VMVKNSHMKRERGSKMPYSFSTFDDYIFNFISNLEPASVLDVGPGLGKIGSMVSKAARLRDFSCSLHAYEIYEQYIKQFELKWIYDKIYNQNIMEIMNRKDVSYELVVFGDSLEHLTKEDGLKLLEFLLPKCSYIIIKTPDNYPQGALFENKYEAHLSNWSKEDFKSLIIHKIEEHINKQIPDQIDLMNLFVLKGDIGV
jgi:2-polyprenyl-3-methyl-5-hydroxy-6-metoxy-1,4-benzoquinol methylase